MLLAGRGFGKTRVLSETLREWATSGRYVRIALVARTAADVRDVLVEGQSGILAVSPNGERPLWEPSRRRLTWPNGAIATTYSAEEPDQLRGPQHDAALADEVAAWSRPDTWDQLTMGLRLGTDPRVVIAAAVIYGVFIAYFAFYSRHHLVAGTPEEEFAAIQNAEKALH